MKCKHDGARLLRWWNDGAWSPVPLLHEPDARWCFKCGDYVSLGPSTDTPATDIEVRAAELAVRAEHARSKRSLTTLTDIGFDGAEVAGWIECKHDSQKVPEQPGEWAGWLCRAIVDHEGSTP